MVFWQPRWVYAEEDGLCYQKVAPGDFRPIGRAKKIPFAAMVSIDGLASGDEFMVQCGVRDYTFKAEDEAHCATMVRNLRQLREREHARGRPKARRRRVTFAAPSGAAERTRRSVSPATPRRGERRRPVPGAAS